MHASALLLALLSMRVIEIIRQGESMTYQTQMNESLAYLNSPGALQDMERDSYWPKWNSPWWHMLLLHEMGEAKKIPAALIEKHVDKLRRSPLKIFPILPEEMPAHLSPHRDSPCHCQLGNVYQVLAKWGVDVDQELPWMREWFLKYQMADGGLNCDDGAYRVKDEVPSSMVGTISVFEAVLFHTNREWTEAEKKFLDLGAQFLMKRKLMLGSETVYNADERESAKKWGKLCFPRYYLYDVLRGLNALLGWAEKTGNRIPSEAIEDVVNSISERFPDGNVKLERKSYEGVGTIAPNEKGEWVRRSPAFLFPLLEVVSETGNVSPFLTKQWSEAREKIRKVSDLKVM